MLFLVFFAYLQLFYICNIMCSVVWALLHEGIEFCYIYDVKENEFEIVCGIFHVTEKVLN